MINRTVWDIFCKVIDNFGDIGVSYRLTKELATNNQKIRLFVSDLKAFNRIEPKVNINLYHQSLDDNIEIILWNNQSESLNLIKQLTPSNIIIEMFACNLPEIYISKITNENIWINLEYLSAEDWVEEYHQKLSYEGGHFKYFFFPGFTSKTGGVNFEGKYLNKLPKQCKNQILEKLNINRYVSNNTLLCSIFCYENNVILKLLCNIKKDVLFIIPQSIFSDYLLDKASSIGLTKIDETLLKNENNIFIKIIPMTNQENYDNLLLSCDLNIVRGEDSFVRAQILSKPFIWNIYQQKDNIHLVKLKSFLDKYIDKSIVSPKVTNSIYDFSNAINTPLYENNDYLNDFYIIIDHLQELKQNSIIWRKNLIKNNSLCLNLIKFAQLIEK